MLLDASRGILITNGKLTTFVVVVGAHSVGLDLLGENLLHLLQRSSLSLGAGDGGSGLTGGWGSSSLTITALDASIEMGVIVRILRGLEFAGRDLGE